MDPCALAGVRASAPMATGVHQYWPRGRKQRQHTNNTGALVLVAQWHSCSLVEFTNCLFQVGPSTDTVS